MGRCRVDVLFEKGTLIYDFLQGRTLLEAATDKGPALCELLF
jgi:hypothetical protein